MGNVKYGYARVSTTEQNVDRQVIAIKDLGVEMDNIFIDKQSGRDFDRPNYQRMVKMLKVGDELYISSLDRLGRDYEEIKEQWRILTKERKVAIRVINMQLLNTDTENGLLEKFISDQVLQIMSFVAQTEREQIRERQAQGINVARARGVHMGRPPKKLPDNFEELVECYRNKKITRDELLKICGISKTTFYRKINK